MTGFTGFGDGAVEFFDGLEADNSKAYWTDQRAVYEADVRAPMQALLAALEPEFGPGKIFRPYRDVRFSKDKTPYKTHCGGTVGPFYVQVGADGLMAAGGYYGMGADQVARFRTAVDDDRRGTDLQERLAAISADVAVHGEMLKTRPRGFGPDHPRIDLLRHKSLYAARAWAPDDTLHEAGALDRVVATWRVLTPLVEWLADHVGPSGLARR
jgi:uncharacterized protein (TIGR02453 family)